MPLRLDPLAQALNRVVGTNFDTPLGEDRTLVEVIGHDVDGAASFRDAGLQGHGDRVHGARELRKQRRMDVDDPPLELAGKARSRMASYPAHTTNSTSCMRRV